ncbi:hypothetical protein L208DRAFT_1305626 [Tricholoma matsutake]|nr:hypothetical protein L208DRAFT_1305626 [Tricholoma matsutake 945]
MLTEPKAMEPQFPAHAHVVHFFNSGKSIMAGFLDSKEIIAWSLSPWARLWRHKLATRIGNTAWSTSTGMLLVWNLADGINLYHVTDRPVWIKKLRVLIRQNIVIQVAFGVKGQYAISGTDNGEVIIWDLKSAEPDQILIQSGG